MGPGLSVLLGGRDRLEVQGTALGFSYSELSKTGCKEEPVGGGTAGGSGIQSLKKKKRQGIRPAVMSPGSHLAPGSS